MKLYKQEKSKYWWCSFYVDGERRRVSTEEKSKQAAYTAACQIIEKAQQGISLKPKPVPTLEEYATTFLDYVDKHSAIEEKTRECYRYGWHLLKSQEIVKIRMDRITTQHVDTIAIEGSPSTHNTALRTLRRMLFLAVDEGLIRRDRMPHEPKFPKITLRKERRRKTLIEPSDDELISAILQSKRPGRPFGALTVAWAIHMDTGLRPFEVVNLRVEDIDFQRKTICVGRSKTEGGEGRFLPISPRMKDLLVRQVAGRFEGWLFPSPKYPGKPIKRGTLTHSFAAVRRRANLPAAKKLYTARHTFGTELMNRTGDPYLVMEAMGHSDLQVGKWYQHKDVEQIADAVNQRNEEWTEKNGHTFGHTGDLVQ